MPTREISFVGHISFNKRFFHPDLSIRSNCELCWRSFASLCSRVQIALCISFIVLILLSTIDGNKYIAWAICWYCGGGRKQYQYWIRTTSVHAQLSPEYLEYRRRQALPAYWIAQLSLLLKTWRPWDMSLYNNKSAHCRKVPKMIKMVSNWSKKAF